MTTYVPVTAQLQDVAQHVRRCPQPTIVRAYVAAARKLCTESRWLRLTATTQTEDATKVYSFEDDLYLDVVGIRAMERGIKPDTVTPIKPLDPTLWNANAEDGPPRYYSYIPEGRFALFPTPDTVYDITSTVEVAPKLSAAQLPSELLVKWHAAISAGALEYLLSLPRQLWSNPQMATKYAGILASAINNARAEEQRAHNTGTVQVRGRRLW